MFFDRDSFDFGTAKTDMGLYRQQLEMHIIREIVSDRVIIITAKKWKTDEIVMFINENYGCNLYFFVLVWAI